MVVRIPTTSISPERRTSWSARAESLPLLQETTAFVRGVMPLKSYHDPCGEHAADAECRLVIAADCCADRDPEVHRVRVEKVFTRRATVVTVKVVVRGARLTATLSYLESDAGMGQRN